MKSATLARVEAHVFRTPIKEPVRTSFGTMTERAAVFVRVEDSDGARGWGEIWCNFPNAAAEHRALLFADIVAPRALGKPLDDPVALWAEIDRALHVLRIQSGDAGAFSAAAAGLDLALHDLRARKRGLPLWRALGGRDESAVPVYASGVNPGRDALKTVDRMRAIGHRAFKLKIGFGKDRDLANVAAVRSALGDDVDLMVDANQAWSLDTAIDMAEALESFYIGWLEEPLRADRPWNEWQALRDRTSIALAAGENIASDAGFDAALEANALKVVQPDIAKWGGFTKGVPLARRVLASGARFCPLPLAVPRTHSSPSQRNAM